MADLVVKNAKLVLPDKMVKGGFEVENGKIVKISSDANLASEGNIIDAGGNFILPGLIDCHVHFREPGASSKEDWVTGTSAAAAGGVTTVLDMPNTQPPMTSLKALEDKRNLIASRAKVDYGFHFAASIDNLDDLTNLGSGIASVKIYMSTTTGNLKVTDNAVIYEELKILAEKGIIATVHAEDNEMVQYGIGELCLKENPTAEDYAQSRPNICAANAANTIIYMTKMTGCRLHLCHVSTAEEVGLIMERKREGLTCEITPHHLFLSYDDIKKLGNYSKVNPPLRSKKDVSALWEAVRAGAIDVISTDHAPHLPEEKERDIQSASAGMPGVETLLPLLLNEANKKTIGLPDIARMCSQNPARIFGLAGKGALKKGYDADFVIVDMEQKKKVEAKNLFTKCGWTPYDGWKLKGWPVQTYVRGQLAFDNGAVLGSEGKEVTYIEK